MEDSSEVEDNLLQNEEQSQTQFNKNNSRNSRDRKPIGVIGTGNAAIAFTKRLLASGYSVVVGSRKPAARHSTLTQLGHCLCGAELTSIADCIRRCDVIIVAIHMENFEVTLGHFSFLTRGKILVDMSNRETRHPSRSNAEYLASILPEAEVVKAFNTISAYVMENNLDVTVDGHKVLVACDNEKVRGQILDLSRSMGFHSVDSGSLRNSLSIEDFVLKVFTHWKIPIYSTLGVFILWSFYVVLIYYVELNEYEWEQIFLKVLNKPVCMTAFTTLALTYLPGQIASIIQVCRGTKHSRFPRILDSWLKSRKQFGLITFALACFHVIASSLMLSPTYYRSWFHQPTILLPVQRNSTTLTSEPIEIPVSSSWMVWKGEVALLFGILAFLSMSVQAVTSIESVANSLNWSEWTCVQSYMGTAVLILVACHAFSMAIPSWLKGGLMRTLRSITFLSLILPLVVLLLKFVFRWTPLYCYLRKIRKGWERQRQIKGTNNRSNLDSIRLGKQDYEPLSDITRQEKTCCGLGEDTVKLEMVGDDGRHFDLSGGKGKCCGCKNGREKIANSKSGGEKCKNSSARFEARTNNAQCGCSNV